MALSQHRVDPDVRADFMLATTSGAGQPRENYTVSLAETMRALAKEGMTVHYVLHSFNCHVDDARNHIVKEFLDTECPVLVFVDDDVGWSGEDLVKLVRHCDADHPIVGGVYPLKSKDMREDYPVRLKNMPTQQADKKGLLEVDGLPTGFMAIRREVIVALDALDHKRRYWTKSQTRDDRPLTSIFERQFVPGRDGEINQRYGGDYNFCRKARKIGFKSFCDPEMYFTHEGSHIWGGHFGNYLRSQNGIPDPRLLGVWGKIAAGDPTEEDFASLFLLNQNAYSATPKLLAECYRTVATLPSKARVLETGSGLTTVVMGMAAMSHNPDVTIHSLEHDPDYFWIARGLLKRFKVRPVWLYYAPLEIEDDQAWYKVPEELPDSFDFLLCDGPPRRFGRNGLWEKVGDRVQSASVWMMDDADDKKELKEFETHAKAAGRAVEVRGENGSRQFAISKGTNNGISE